jgi:hypothetical protein
MEQTQCSKTLAFKLRTPVYHPEESIRHSEHGESLKSRLNIPGRYNAAWPFCDRLGSDHAVATVAVRSVGHSASYFVAAIHAAIRTSYTNGYCITVEFLVSTNHQTGEVMEYQIFWIISQFLQSLQIFLYNACTRGAQLIRGVYSIRRLNFLSCHRPGHGSSFRMHGYEPLAQQLFQLC